MKEATGLTAVPVVHGSARFLESGDPLETTGVFFAGPGRAFYAYRELTALRLGSRAPGGGGLLDPRARPRPVARGVGRPARESPRRLGRSREGRGEALPEPRSRRGVRGRGAEGPRAVHSRRGGFAGGADSDRPGEAAPRDRIARARARLSSPARRVPRSRGAPPRRSDRGAARRVAFALDPDGDRRRRLRALLRRPVRQGTDRSGRLSRGEDPDRSRLGPRRDPLE